MGREIDAGVTDELWTDGWMDGWMVEDKASRDALTPL